MAATAVGGCPSAPHGARARGAPPTGPGPNARLCCFQIPPSPPAPGGSGPPAPAGAGRRPGALGRGPFPKYLLDPQPLVLMRRQKIGVRLVQGQQAVPVEAAFVKDEQIAGLCARRHRDTQSSVVVGFRGLRAEVQPLGEAFLPQFEDRLDLAAFCLGRALAPGAAQAKAQQLPGQRDRGSIHPPQPDRPRVARELGVRFREHVLRQGGKVRHREPEAGV